MIRIMAAVPQHPLQKSQKLGLLGLKVIGTDEEFHHQKRVQILCFSKSYKKFLAIFCSNLYLMLACHKKSDLIKTGYQKNWQKYTMIFNGKIYRKYFISSSAYSLIMWLMRSPKNFEKIAILKIWQLISFWGDKIHFGKK